LCKKQKKLRTKIKNASFISSFSGEKIKRKTRNYIFNFLEENLETILINKKTKLIYKNI